MYNLVHEMAEKNILHLLILFSILCQGIIGTLADEDIGEASDSHMRKKRVINVGPNGRLTTRIQAVPFIVDIRENNRSSCVGAILSHYSVLTASACVNNAIGAYKVNSGSGYTQTSKTHIITSKSVYFGNPPHQIHDGIALITVDPSFYFDLRTGFIVLNTRPLPTGTIASVTGWGCHHPIISASQLPRRLRTISVPIIDHEECLHAYPRNQGLSTKHICTYDEQQLCAHTDLGTPLVINNRLAGVHVFKGESLYTKNPDVFIDVQHRDYHQWITEHALLM